MINFLEFEIGGKSRGFLFGLGFLGELLQHYDIDTKGLGHLMIKNPFSVTPAILYYGHKHHCIREKKPIDFELWNVEDWIEEMPDTLNNKDIEKAMMILIDSIKKHLKLDGDEGPKKK